MNEHTLIALLGGIAESAVPIAAHHGRASGEECIYAFLCRCRMRSWRPLVDKPLADARVRVMPLGVVIVFARD